MIKEEIHPDSELNEETVQELVQMGWQLIRGGKMEDASSFFRVLTHHRPDHPMHWFSLGQTYQHRQMYKEAVSAYQRAIRDDRMNPFLFYHLAECHFSLSHARLGMLALNWCEWVARAHRQPFPYYSMIEFLRETWSNRAAQEMEEENDC